MKEDDTCEPFTTNAEMGVTISEVKGVPLDPSAGAIPCGVAAKYFFNDQFRIFDVNGTEVAIANEGIAWPSDKEQSFKNEDLSK